MVRCSLEPCPLLKRIALCVVIGHGPPQFEIVLPLVSHARIFPSHICYLLGWSPFRCLTELDSPAGGLEDDRYRDVFRDVGWPMPRWNCYDSDAGGQYRTQRFISPHAKVAGEWVVRLITDSSNSGFDNVSGLELASFSRI